MIRRNRCVRACARARVRSWECTYARKKSSRVVCGVCARGLCVPCVLECVCVCACVFGVCDCVIVRARVCKG